MGEEGIKNDQKNPTSFMDGPKVAYWALVLKINTSPEYIKSADVFALSAHIHCLPE